MKIFLGQDEKWHNVLAQFSNVYHVVANDVIIYVAAKGWTVLTIRDVLK